MQVTNNVLVFKLGGRFIGIYFIKLYNKVTNIILYAWNLLPLKYFTDELVFQSFIMENQEHVFPSNESNQVHFVIERKNTGGRKVRWAPKRIKKRNRIQGKRKKKSPVLSHVIILILDHSGSYAGWNWNLLRRLYFHLRLTSSHFHPCSASRSLNSS